MSSAQTTIIADEPKEGDGCSCRSWRCESPSREDMEKGRVDGTSPELVKLECKRCPVCRMIFCRYHMSESQHMMDCNFRSNQERQLLEQKRTEDAIKEQARKKQESRDAKNKADFEAKERLRREAIADRNEKYKGR